MEKVECKSCSAIVDKTLEFCSSCGDWLGLNINDIRQESDDNSGVGIERAKVPQLKCPNCSTLNIPSVRNCKACSEPLVKPLSSYGATSLPNRKEVPGIRAVFFLTFLIPVIALASYIYNSNVSEEVMEQVEVVQQSTTTSSTTTIKDIMELQYPMNCSSSSSYNEGNGWSCENLYDGEQASWQDNSLKCVDGWVEFNFPKELFFEFIVFVNLDDSKAFKRNYKARDLLITTSDEIFSLEHELENDNTSQWVPLNITTSYLKVSILSAYPGEEVSGSPAFDECAIQEIRFYGRG